LVELKEIIKFENFNIETLVHAALGLLVISIIVDVIEGNRRIIYNPPKPLPRKDFTDSDKKAVRFNQSFRCAECHQFNENLQFHHKDGHSWNNHISNCQGLCPNCHVRKTKEQKNNQKSLWSFSGF